MELEWRVQKRRPSCSRRTSRAADSGATCPQGQTRVATGRAACRPHQAAYLHRAAALVPSVHRTFDDVASCAAAGDATKRSALYAQDCAGSISVNAPSRRLGLSRNWAACYVVIQSFPAPIRSQTLCTNGVSVLVSFSGSTKWGRFFCSTNAGAVTWRLVGE
jgi:hypothetical protein